MKFSDFLNESQSSRERTAIENFRKKTIDALDKVSGDTVKQNKLGKAIFKEIHKKYYDGYDYMYDTLLSQTSDFFVRANAWAALEGGRDFFSSINDTRMVSSFQHDIDKIDKTKFTTTGAAESAKRVIDAVKTKNSDIANYTVHSPTSVKFSRADQKTISVKESVKVVSANLYFQHKPKFYKKVDTVTSKVVLIIAIGGHNDGEIQHVIYDDNGTTKITSYSAFNLVDDALNGTYNSKTITKI